MKKYFFLIGLLLSCYVYAKPIDCISKSLSFLLGSEQQVIDEGGILFDDFKYIYILLEDNIGYTVTASDGSIRYVSCSIPIETLKDGHFNGCVYKSKEQFNHDVNTFIAVINGYNGFLKKTYTLSGIKNDTYQFTYESIALFTVTIFTCYENVEKDGYGWITIDCQKY